jgi:hypothetical protein
MAITNPPAERDWSRLLFFAAVAAAAAVLGVVVATVTSGTATVVVSVLTASTFVVVFVIAGILLAAHRRGTICEPPRGLGVGTCAFLVLGPLTTVAMLVNTASHGGA